MYIPFLSLVVVGLPVACFGAQDFQGADAVLKKLAEFAQSKPTPDKVKDPVIELRQDLTAFSDRASTLSVDEAAAQWLKLFDQYQVIPSQQIDRSLSPDGPLNLGTLLEALPPSTAWPVLAGLLEKRKASTDPLIDATMHLFAGILRRDAGSFQNALAALQKAGEKKTTDGDQQGQYLGHNVVEMCQSLEMQIGSPADRAAAVEKLLTSREKTPVPTDAYMFDANSVSIPDLVSLVGEKRAVPLLEHALRLKAQLQVEGDATQRMAAQIALRNAKDLQTPCWGLISTQDDVPLYEALAARFPRSEADGPGRDAADRVYMLHLIEARRFPEAIPLALQLMGGQGARDSVFGSALDVRHGRGPGPDELAFLHELLDRAPSLPLWDEYVTFAVQLGAADEALALLKSKMTEPGLSGPALARMKLQLAKASLAADRLEEGIRLYREIIGAPPGEPPAGQDKIAIFKQTWSKFGLEPPAALLRQARQTGAPGMDSRMSDHVTLCLQLVTIGRLLNRPDLVAEGLAAARAVYEKIPDTDFERSSAAQKMEISLVESGREAEAEALLINELASGVRPKSSREQQSSNRGLAELQTNLAWIYLKNDRAADVVKLLEQSPYWEQTDLAGIQGDTFQNTPLLVIAAQALAKVGRKDESRKIALRALQDFPGNDRVYENLLLLGTDGLEPLLDAAYQRDRFEERPLIWKAKIQFDAGRLDEAERTVRAAIAVDPSDGEEGKGDRMRAYAVLGDILEKNKDPDQARIMRGAVAAIRLSENADDWWQAGMVTRAAHMYEQALNLFSDAYCIQSRLALRYGELGDYVHAEQHYRRAYELMPESFGRVESHCFGCEGAFAGARAQAIAETVFNSLAIKAGVRPQVFYLFGYLREQQNRPGDALLLYRKAVALDPDYLNAWKNISSLSNAANSSPEDLDAVALALLRIDPSGRHSSANLEEAHDLGKIWDAVLAAERVRPKNEIGPVFALSASRNEMERRQPAEFGNDPFSGRGPSRNFSRRSDVDWRAQFVRLPQINAVVTLLDTLARLGQP